MNTPCFSAPGWISPLLRFAAARSRAIRRRIPTRDCDTPYPCDGYPEPPGIREININREPTDNGINKENFSNPYQPKVKEMTIAIPGALERDTPEGRKKLLKQKEFQEEFDF